MGYTEHWELKGLRKQNYGELSDVIIGTNWKVTLTDDEGFEGSFTGATPFKPEDLNKDGFVDYKDLTEELVLGWVKNTVSGSYPTTNYWDHILGRIKKEIDAKKYNITTVSETQLPWYTGSLSSSYTPEPLHGDALYSSSLV